AETPVEAAETPVEAAEITVPAQVVWRIEPGGTSLSSGITAGPTPGTDPATMIIAPGWTDTGLDAAELAPGLLAPTVTTPAVPTGRRRLRPRRWWTRLTVLVVALTLAGAGGWVLLRDQVTGTANTPAPTQPAAASPAARHPNLLATSRDSFEALLDRRGDAVTDRDQKAFLADLDPAASKLISKQKLLFKNLGKLPVSSFEYDSWSYQPPQPVVSGNLDGPFNPGSATIATQVQFTDADPRPTTARYAVKVELRSGKLVITDISSKGTTSPYSPTPWDAAELTVVRTEHMVVGVTPDVKDRAREVADAAERAYDTSRGLWPKRARNEFVIFATGKRSTFESWYGFGNRTPDFSVGRAISVPTCCETADEKLGDSTSTHIIIDLGELPDEIDLEWTLAHELTHAVSQPRADASYDVPTWAVEGYAEYVGISLLDARGYFAYWARDVRAYVKDGKFKNKLPADDNFYGKNSDINYALSVRFFEYLVGEYGESTVKNFFFYLNAMDRTDVDAAMRKYFKASDKKIVADWSSWVRNS
ncbi:MAG: hypothetical protein L0Y54_00545, partial [Sporichthyaceae bacterium]|nr:hypothetical protein [Sporichthyaceae bacterium]